MYVSIHPREVYYKELAGVIMEADEPRRQAGNPGELVLEF